MKRSYHLLFDKKSAPNTIEMKASAKIKSLVKREPVHNYLY